MGKLNKKAFAIMTMCENNKDTFGITVNPKDGSCEFVWAFKIKKEQAKREGYDKTNVRGVVVFDEDFNGCPYCGSKQFYICNECGIIACYHGQEIVTCPKCNTTSMLQNAEYVDLSGSGF